MSIFSRSRLKGSLVVVVLAFFSFTMMYINFLSRGEIFSSNIVGLVTIKDLYKGPVAVDQENPKLIQMIQERILPAANSQSKLNLSNDNIEMGQLGQVSYIVDYFKHKKGGFFIEAGAFDGEYLSNTLYLEKNLSWSGLLIEPNKMAFNSLASRNRKSQLLNACLSLHKYPEEVVFDAADVVGAIQDDTNPDNDTKSWVPAEKRSQYPLQCFPLFSILLALHNPRVDLLSLDIEGAELPVLATLPWQKTNIETILLEVEHSKESDLVALLASAGYRVEHSFGKQDIFFVKK